MLKPSVSRPLVVCCESLCHVFEHEHRVIELRDEMWYVNKIRVKWVQLLKLAFCAAFVTIASAMSSVAAATEAGDWYLLV